MTTTKDTLDELTARRQRMSSELKDINDRLSRGDGDKGGLIVRGDNLAKGLIKLDDAIKEAEQAYQAEIFAGLKAGGYGLEPGSVGGPLPSIAPTAVAGDSIAARLVKAMRDAKFDTKTNPSVTVDGYSIIAPTSHTKAQTLPSPEEWARRAGVIVPLGQDDRFMWRAMPVERLDAAATSITDFKVTVATVTGTIERDPDATTDKADLATTTTLANDPVKQFAITIDDIPNQVLTSVPLLQAYLLDRGEFELEQALDDHVYNQIVAATPPHGNTGTGLIMQVRSAVKTMRATGARPRLLVVNPTDSETLDTYTTADGIFLLTDPATSPGGTGPVWSLNRIERIGAGTEPPYVIDPTMLGVLYLGEVKIDADPYTGFKKNLTTLRIEFNALMHIRNANGARRIAAT